MANTSNAALSRTSKSLAVANYFIYRSNLASKESLPGITNKKLQKLLYYSQAWSLALRNKRLFKDDIEAWVHGPAVRSVYTAFKQYSFGEIKTDVSKDDFSILSAEELELLNTIWSVYGKYDADYLEALTHSESPWQEARNGLAAHQSSSKVISPDTMKAFYGEKIKK